MSNQYELPRAVGPQRHISSKVALNTEMVAALKFTTLHCLETHIYGLFSSFCIENQIFCSHIGRDILQILPKKPLIKLM